MRLSLVLFSHKLTRSRRAIVFNNYWHAFRERTVKNIGIKEAVEETGIKVHQPEEIFTSHLPQVPSYDYDFTKDDPVRREIEDVTKHPFYHERPAFSYHSSHHLVTDMQLDIAKNLTKTVEVEAGFPEQLKQTINRVSAVDLLPNEDEVIREHLWETMLCDSTQKRLPRRIHVPYIGWHPVLSTMSAKVPYKVTRSYQYNLRREYGIPVKRRNMNLIRGLFRYCDFLSVNHPQLLNTSVLESCVLRQFFEFRNHLVRIYFELPFLLTGEKPLAPFANKDVVDSTENMDLVDISPCEPLVNTEDINVYRHENNFPILDMNHSAPHAHLGVFLLNNIEPYYDYDTMAARSLMLAFLTAMGQARLRFGPDTAGQLPDPITVQFLTTYGKEFYFSVFQLNTLNLDDPTGVKNILWQREELVPLFDVCDYVKAVPTLTGYNPEVFKTIAAMYLQGA